MEFIQVFIDGVFRGDLIGLIKAVGYVGLFGIVFAETGLFLGFFLPGDSLLFVAGFLAGQHFFFTAGIDLRAVYYRYCRQYGRL